MDWVVRSSDIFMDDMLLVAMVDSCRDTWSSDEVRSLAISLHALSEMNHVDKSEGTEPGTVLLPVFNACNGYLCEDQNGIPIGKVRIRSRYSYNKSQEPAVLDTAVESISMDDI